MLNSYFSVQKRNRVSLLLEVCSDHIHHLWIVWDVLHLLLALCERSLSCWENEFWCIKHTRGRRIRGNIRIINWRRKSESYYLLTRFDLGRLWCHETVLMYWLRLEIPFKFLFSFYKSDNRLHQTSMCLTSLCVCQVSPCSFDSVLTAVE